MQYREFQSLTSEEITQIVTDIFKPTQITNIKTSGDGFICTIHMEWETTNDDGSLCVMTIPDVIELRDPFVHGSTAIVADFSLSAQDYFLFKQYCFAKGIVPWLKDNPYLVTHVSETT